MPPPPSPPASARTHPEVPRGSPGETPLTGTGRARPAASWPYARPRLANSPSPRQPTASTSRRRTKLPPDPVSAPGMHRLLAPRRNPVGGPVSPHGVITRDVGHGETNARTLPARPGTDRRRPCSRTPTSPASSPASGNAKILAQADQQRLLRLLREHARASRRAEQADRRITRLLKHTRPAALPLMNRTAAASSHPH